MYEYSVLETLAAVWASSGNLKEFGNRMAAMGGVAKEKESSWLNP
jgi:hypothetical protein